jgi:hypothetical protein
MNKALSLLLLILLSAPFAVSKSGETSTRRCDGNADCNEGFLSES